MKINVIGDQILKQFGVANPKGARKMRTKNSQAKKKVLERSSIFKEIKYN